MNKSLCLFYLLLFLCFSSYAQKPGSSIDVQHYNFAIQLSDRDNFIRGQASITLRYLTTADTISLDLVKTNRAGKGMMVSSVTEKGRYIDFKQDTGKLIIINPVKEGNKRTYVVTYTGMPADGLIISTNKFKHRTFFGDNWPNRAHNWLPCVDDPADKATVDFDVIAPAHYQVIANGEKTSETMLSNNMKETKWKESAKLPTKVMVIGVADFAVDHTGDVNKVPVYTYVFPENKEAGFSSYAVAKEILGFFAERIGPYAYEKLANVQSKTIFGGMENAGCIFYFEDSVGDKGIESLMAHEIAHQWFGDAASEKSFAHLWLSEGFATFMTNFYLEEKYGADTLKRLLADDKKKIFEFENTRFSPVVDTAVKDSYMQLLNANSYQKGGWILHMLRMELGEEAFWKGIRNYYQKYNGGNADTDDLRTVMEEASQQNLEHFFKQWLYTPGHPHFSIKWSFDKTTKVVNVEIGQVQDKPYECTIECSINGEIHDIDVSKRFEIFSIPINTTPSSVVFDPDGNLLAEFKVETE